MGESGELQALALARTLRQAGLPGVKLDLTAAALPRQTLGDSQRSTVGAADRGRESSRGVRLILKDFCAWSSEQRLSPLSWRIRGVGRRGFLR